MDKFKTFFGTVAPLDKNNIDTDAIIPRNILNQYHAPGLGLTYLMSGDTLKVVSLEMIILKDKKTTTLF